MHLPSPIYHVCLQSCLCAYQQNIMQSNSNNSSFFSAMAGLREAQIKIWPELAEPSGFHLQFCFHITSSPVCFLIRGVFRSLICGFFCNFNCKAHAAIGGEMLTGHRQLKAQSQRYPNFNWSIQPTSGLPCGELACSDRTCGGCTRTGLPGRVKLEKCLPPCPACLQSLQERV